MAPKTRSRSKSANRGCAREGTEASQPSRDSENTVEERCNAHNQCIRAQIRPSLESLAEKAADFSRRYRSWRIALVAVTLALVAAGLAVLLSPSVDVSPRERHPCSCAVAASTSNRLAKVVLSRRTGVSGVHFRMEELGADALAFATKCSGAAVITLRGPFESVDQLRAALVAPFKDHRSRCVVWVTTPDVIKGVANSLKGLMENNALSGRTVVPARCRAILVLKAPESREQLKSILPHRVVHMLNEV
ncbi:hypothetical protein LSCM1_05179 [Leishmania martiniquensis]|uniref:Uncharacterized protein n=1 Tax=Leishmania martiniquensis TaxID=1580590 RepID=A0A836KLX0_9TRYP|nr:hypothetical protein LSCM1_05179 [Leishmania martiniquensis]